ncbi:MAG: pilus assembly protein CpaD [Caulobacteraceae bacterium]|nr:CpaD family pilus assembly protein [Caulobacter sp.]RYF88164.1 MAG: pilus assembly protein CpaD [Caulobacteraceae bacterium]
MTPLTPRILLLSALSAAALLAGCASTPGPQSDLTSRTALDAWTREVRVTPQPQDIRLAPHETGLSVSQANALEGFVVAWMRAEARDVIVRASDTGPGARGANRVAWDARDRLVSLGVPASNIKMTAYDGEGDPKAPVIISFNQYVAEVPSCGSWRDLSHSNDNLAYSNFGCAMTANIAAQVANPQDLITPRDAQLAEGGNREIIYEKYRKGEATGATRDEKATGQVSQVVVN